MNYLASIAAAASTSVAILTGTANAQEPVQKLVDVLDLPMNDKKVATFNNATKSGVTEECFRQDANTVACTMRVMTNEALLDATYQGVIYQINDAGDISITHGRPDVGSWTPDTFAYDFKPAAKENKHSTWAPGSPLAVPAGSVGILQNDVRRVETLAGGMSVKICSNLPINENRGLEICTVFGAATVQSTTMIKALSNGTVVTSDKATAVRPEPFDVTSGDQDYLQRYLDQSASGPVFTTAAPYKPR